MNFDSRKLLYAAIGIFTLFVAIYTFSIFNGFLGLIGNENLFLENHPLSIMLIMGALIFAGIFIFNAAGKIFVNSVK